MPLFFLIEKRNSLDIDVFWELHCDLTGNGRSIIPFNGNASHWEELPKRPREESQTPSETTEMPSKAVLFSYFPLKRVAITAFLVTMPINTP